MHHVVSPIALILTAINPCVGAGALHLVQNETALEGASILESQTASTVLLAILVLALVDGAILPGLLTRAIILVVFPFALVLGAVSVGVSSLS